MVDTLLRECLYCAVGSAAALRPARPVTTQPLSWGYYGNSKLGFLALFCVCVCVYMCVRVYVCVYVCCQTGIMIPMKHT